MNHTHVHAVVEVVDKTGKATGAVSTSVNVVAKAIAASHAFRKYDWLKNAPVKNTSDNLREMVVNANARIVYDFSVKYGSKIEKFNTFATVATALADSAGEILDIIQSKDTWDIKSAKLGTQATAVAMNVLTGVVTAPAHSLLLSMQGYCNIVDIARGERIGTCGSTLKAIDAVIESSAKQVSDGKNIYTFVNTTINPKISKALGLWH
jgi:hypothetical protein